MVTMKSEYVGELRTRITHLQSGNEIITDAPVDNKGKGEAFSPTDMVAAAVGSCMMTIIGIASNTHGFSMEGIKVDVTKVMAGEPRRIGEVKIALSFNSQYTDKEKVLIKKAALSCPVSLSLHPDIKQTITFNFN